MAEFPIRFTFRGKRHSAHVTIDEKTINFVHHPDGKTKQKKSHHWPPDEEMQNMLLTPLRPKLVVELEKLEYWESEYLAMGQTPPDALQYEIASLRAEIVQSGATFRKQQADAKKAAKLREERDQLERVVFPKIIKRNSECKQHPVIRKWIFWLPTWIDVLQIKRHKEGTSKELRNEIEQYRKALRDIGINPMAESQEYKSHETLSLSRFSELFEDSSLKSLYIEWRKVKRKHDPLAAIKIDGGKVIYRCFLETRVCEDTKCIQVRGGKQHRHYQSAVMDQLMPIADRYQCHEDYCPYCDEKRKYWHCEDHYLSHRESQIAENLSTLDDATKLRRRRVSFRQAAQAILRIKAGSINTTRVKRR